MRLALAVWALALPLVAGGQSAPVNKVAQCESLVVLQSTAAQSKVRPFSLALHGSNGAQLSYFGVHHTYDPADTQFVAMQNAWRDFGPTVAFYEGTGTKTATSADSAMLQDGEPGLLRFLAAKSGIAAHSLEPSREDEVNALVAKFTPEQLVMFYVTRPVMELRTRLHAGKPALDTAVFQTLARMHRIPALKNALPDTAALRGAFAKLAPGVDVTEVPDSWFNPSPSTENSGKALFNNINTASSFFRDVFMYRQLATAARTPGARVFAEVGRDHIPAEAAALRCAVGDAR